MFAIKFDTDNAAFDGEDGEAEIARILRNIADDFENGRNPRGSGARILDINGNVVGSWKWNK